MKISNLIKSGCKYITDSNYRWIINSGLGMYNKMPDEEYLRRKFYATMGKKLNLQDPQTFNEKLQWLKLYNQNPKYTMMVDKFRVRQYIAEKIGDEYLIPLLRVWDKPDDIDFDTLPDQFVLKCNHNSGLGMCICKDKTKLDIRKTKAELKKGLKQDYYLSGREWPYKNVQRRIVCEEYMADGVLDTLNDYKLMCFNGKVQCSYVCSERFTNDLKVTFFDNNWNELPFERHFHKSTKPIEKPKCFSKMIALAEVLSEGLPFVRVDFYEINGKVYFGELTFFPGDGFREFTPEEWDYKLGEMLTLPEKSVQ